MPMNASIQPTQAPASAAVMEALRAASRKTGLDFDFLLDTARRESSLNTQAKSETSSASGLFQFIDQTWLGLVKQHGARHGLSAQAEAIEQTEGRRYVVASEETRSAILALRQDAKLSALMAGESARQSRQTLETMLGRNVDSGDLYAAHILGPRGAGELIRLAEQDPGARADLAFPQAAKANTPIFYREDGSARTVAELYAWAGRAANGVPAPALARAVRGPMDLSASAVAGAALEAEGREMLAQRARPAGTAGIPASDATAEPSLRTRIPFRLAATESVPKSGEPQARSVPSPTPLLSPGMMELLAAYRPAQGPRRI
jgi:Transglycosylase SLT domain